MRNRLGLVVGLLAALAMGGVGISMAGYGPGVGGVGVVLGRTGPRAPGGSATVYSAPNTPSIGSTTVVDTSTVWVQGGSFVGSGDDTQDSIRVAITRLGADTTSILTETYGGAQTRDTISDNTNLKADTTYRAWIKYKGAAAKSALWSAWSAPDTFVNTQPGGGGVGPDMFMPSGMDTVDSRDFCDAYPVAISTASDDSGRSPVGYNNWTGDAQGGQKLPTALTTNRARDTITVAGIGMVDNCLWEMRYDGANITAAGDYHFHPAGGNGPSAGSSVGPVVYTRISLLYEYASLCSGCVNYDNHNNGEKIWRWNEPGDGLLMDWQLGSITLVNSSGGGGSCAEPYANTWYLYYPSDTTSTASGCPHKGALIPEAADMRGLVIHLWQCLDPRPPDGSEIASWGVVTENQQGIAAYWDDMSIPESYTGFYLDHTYGGGNPPWPPAQSRWVDDWVVMESSSASCEVPS